MSEPTKEQEKLEYVHATLQANLNVPKSQYSDYGGFNYRSAEDILEAVKKMRKDISTPFTLTLDDKIVELSGRWYVKATATLRVGGKSISASAFAREPQEKKKMDDAQITGATSSYARKYALNGLFALDDQKDSDTKGKEKDKANSKRSELTPQLFDKMKQAILDGNGQTVKDRMDKYDLKPGQKEQLDKLLTENGYL